MAGWPGWTAADYREIRQPRLGVTCSVRSTPLRHVRVAARVVFTRNGVDLYGDAARLRLRRSFCKAWSNDKWRDFLLTFLFWIAGGVEFIGIPFGEGTHMRLRLPPMRFEASFGIDASDDTATLDDVRKRARRAPISRPTMNCMRKSRKKSP